MAKCRTCGHEAASPGPSRLMKEATAWLRTPGAKQYEDIHFHLVLLPDGTELETGPPIEMPMPDAEEAPAPPPPPPAEPKRAPRGSGRKSAAAPIPDEKTAVALAFTAKNADLLPGPAREIYDRMRTSYLRFVAHRGASGTRPKTARPLESYAETLAWRAVAQAYDLIPDTQKRLAPRRTVTKTAPLGAIASSDNGRYFVPAIAKWRDAEDHHERIENRPIPGTEGVIVVVGTTRPSGRKNIIGVLVPYDVAGDQPSGVGAVGWVKRNWELVWRVGMAEVDLASSVREPILKFVARATDARERISYGVVYAPWEVDLQGQYATAKSISDMAHRFISSRSHDAKLMHRYLYTPAGQRVGEVVESFIARRGDPDYPDGAWVAGVKWSDEVWPDVASGALRGFSMGGDWTVIPIREAA